MCFDVACFKRSDSGERCGVEKAAFPLSPLLLPRFYFFALPFTLHRSPLSERLEQASFDDFVRTQKRTQSHHVLRTICLDLWVRRHKLFLMREIDVFSPQAWLDSRIMRIQYCDGINFDWPKGWQCWNLASKNVRVEESNTRLEKRRATWNA